MIRARHAIVLTLLVATSLVMTSGRTGADSAPATLRATSEMPGVLTSSMPIARLTFSGPVRASRLSALVTRPALHTVWQQIGPDSVQATLVGPLDPLLQYAIKVPRAVRCSSRCVVTTVATAELGATVNVVWEDQLLAELGYLPLSFTPTTAPANAAEQTIGTYQWKYQNLPDTLVDQWSLGTDNVILKGAVMAFQDQHHLATTGIADPMTWNDLVAAALDHDFDPAPYNYVNVSEVEPETLTLYVAGVATFHTLVNTGISVAPTPQGTFPVYLRYTSQTMSGTNPDGSHYSDPGIPWISYFDGGAALHGFLRATYGWPQSLGCVEMPFASAQAVWPHTPIGTLVTVG